MCWDDHHTIGIAHQHVAGKHGCITTGNWYIDINCFMQGEVGGRRCLGAISGHVEFTNARDITEAAV
ncbi:hypothetical protein D9M69_609230 [compost metagenome]